MIKLTIESRGDGLHEIISLPGGISRLADGTPTGTWWDYLVANKLIADPGKDFPMLLVTDLDHVGHLIPLDTIRKITFEEVPTP